jgi:hypothetical protein
MVMVVVLVVLGAVMLTAVMVMVVMLMPVVAVALVMTTTSRVPIPRRSHAASAGFAVLTPGALTAPVTVTIPVSAVLKPARARSRVVVAGTEAAVEPAPVASTPRFLHDRSEYGCGRRKAVRAGQLTFLAAPGPSQRPVALPQSGNRHHGA